MVYEEALNPVPLLLWVKPVHGGCLKKAHVLDLLGEAASEIAAELYRQQRREQEDRRARQTLTNISDILNRRTAGNDPVTILEAIKAEGPASLHLALDETIQQTRLASGRQIGLACGSLFGNTKGSETCAMKRE